MRSLSRRKQRAVHNRAELKIYLFDKDVSASAYRKLKNMQLMVLRTKHVILLRTKAIWKVRELAAVRSSYEKECGNSYAEL
jgi:hypothetical protein